MVCRIAPGLRPAKLRVSISTSPVEMMLLVEMRNWTCVPVLARLPLLRVRWKTLMLVPR